jgi:hypothetical protein
VARDWYQKLMRRTSFLSASGSIAWNMKENKPKIGYAYYKLYWDKC